MKHGGTMKFKFVEFVPDQLDDRTLYIAMQFATATHKCCCGCGHEVVTPLSPNDWKLTFDGVSVSLTPSIGNWNFPCQSHYWIRHNRVEWAHRWSREQIDAGRAHNSSSKDEYFEGREHQPAPDQPRPRPAPEPTKRSWWQKLMEKFGIK
jgi:hypothetical protein